MSQLYASGSQSIRVSISISVLLRNIQGWFPLGLSDLISLMFLDSQESSPTPQFESISSSELSLLYGPTLTSTHDSWEKHSFDYTDFCRQEWCLWFLICCVNSANSWGSKTPEFLHQPHKPALCYMSQTPTPAGPPTPSCFLTSLLSTSRLDFPLGLPCYGFIFQAWKSFNSEFIEVSPSSVYTGYCIAHLFQISFLLKCQGTLFLEALHGDKRD